MLFFIQPCFHSSRRHARLWWGWWHTSIFYYFLLLVHLIIHLLIYLTYFHLLFSIMFKLFLDIDFFVFNCIFDQNNFDTPLKHEMEESKVLQWLTSPHSRFADQGQWVIIKDHCEGNKSWCNYILLTDLGKKWRVIVMECQGLVWTSHLV